MRPIEACSRIEASARLAVEQPAALGSEPWASHLRECAQCREQAAAYGHSLAVYRHLEAERLTAAPEGPTWGQLAAALGPAAAGSWRFRMLLAAASLGTLLFVSGLVGWGGADSGEPRPARIVHLPHKHELQLHEVIGQSLAVRPQAEPTSAASETAAWRADPPASAEEDATVDEDAIDAQSETVDPGLLVQGQGVQPALRREPRIGPPNFPVISVKTQGMNPIDYPLLPSRGR
jgi:hypothetical protein